MKIAGTKLAADLVGAARSGSHPDYHGIHLLNTTIIPSGLDGTWCVATVDADVAAWLKRLAAGGGDPGIEPTLPFASHVGHEATALNRLNWILNTEQP